MADLAGYGWVGGRGEAEGGRGRERKAKGGRGSFEVLMRRSPQMLSQVGPKNLRARAGARSTLKSFFSKVFIHHDDMPMQ